MSETVSLVVSSPTREAWHVHLGGGGVRRFCGNLDISNQQLVTNSLLGSGGRTLAVRLGDCGCRVGTEVLAGNS